MTKGQRIGDTFCLSTAKDIFFTVSAQENSKKIKREKKKEIVSATKRKEMKTPTSATNQIIIFFDNNKSFCVFLYTFWVYACVLFMCEYVCISIFVFVCCKAGDKGRALRILYWNILSHKRFTLHFFVWPKALWLIFP